MSLVRALTLSAVVLALAHGAQAQTTRFTITVDNISKGEVLKLSNGKSAPFVSAPVLWAVHMVGTVNANREYFEMGVKDLAHAEAQYPGWLARLLTHPVKGLENWPKLLGALTNAKGAIKVYCEVADI